MICKAPWTKEQVKLLKAYQKFDLFHPHTCTCEGSPVLSVTKDGFVCRKCKRKQTWCNGAIFDMIKYGAYESIHRS